MAALNYIEKNKHNVNQTIGPIMKQGSVHYVNLNPHLFRRASSTNYWSKNRLISSNLRAHKRASKTDL